VRGPWSRLHPGLSPQNIPNNAHYYSFFSRYLLTNAHPRLKMVVAHARFRPDSPTPIPSSHPQNFRVIPGYSAVPVFPALSLGRTQSLLNKLPSKTCQFFAKPAPNPACSALHPRSRTEEEEGTEKAEGTSGGWRVGEPSGGWRAGEPPLISASQPPSRKPSPGSNPNSTSPSANPPSPHGSTCRLGPMLARGGGRQTRFMSGNWRPRTSLLGARSQRSRMVA
jgi:hypothetical protein